MKSRQIEKLEKNLTLDLLELHRYKRDEFVRVADLFVALTSEAREFKDFLHFFVVIKWST